MGSFWAEGFQHSVCLHEGIEEKIEFSHAGAITCWMANDINTQNNNGALYAPKGKFTCYPALKYHALESPQPQNTPEIFRTDNSITAFNQTTVELSVDDLIDILHRSRKTKNIMHARRAHAHLCDSGMENHHALINFVVPMYVECGSMTDAQQVFNRSTHCNEHSWTSLIQGYAEFGDSELVLSLYKAMQEHSVSPSEFTFGAIVKAITRSRYVRRGQEIHTEITMKGLDRDPFLGNSLISLYAKCGAMLEAWEVLGKLPCRDVVSWNAIITGFAEHGLVMETLDCLEYMRLEGVCPDYVTFICSLKAAGTMQAVESGRKIYFEIVKRGMETDQIVGSALVDLYVKTGALSEAEKVFGNLQARDVVSWNALLAGYADNHCDVELFNSLRKMQLDSVCLDATTYGCILKACGSLGVIQQVHIEIVEKGFDRDDYVGSALVSMYAKCRAFAEAYKVFDELLVQDAVAWTALVSGFSDCELAEDALDCLECMQVSCVCPSPLTFACSLNACSTLGALEKGQALHGEITNKGYELDFFVASALVDLYAKTGLLTEAWLLFEQVPAQDLVSWTAIMIGYADHGFNKEALKCLEQMEQEGVFPDCIVFVCAMKACGNLGVLDKGQELHTRGTKLGFLEDDNVGHALVEMYCKCGVLAEAHAVFDKLPHQDTLTWNALIAGYTDQELTEDAMNIFHSMQVKGVLVDVFSWNSVISGHANEGKKDEVFKLFAQLQEQGLLPSIVLYLTIVKACGNTADLETGKKVHAQIFKLESLGASEGCLASVVIDMYGRCASMRYAQVLFDSLTSKELVTWDALLGGYARLGKSELVFDLFNRMKWAGVPPDEVSFINLLNVCTHTGLVDEGQEYFEVMSRDYGMVPSIKHHTCMVDLFGRSGRLDEALMLVQKMPYEPNFVVWCSLLDACQKCGNVEMGRRTFECALRLEAGHAAPFISMARLYMDACMYEDAEIVITLRNEGKQRRSNELIRLASQVPSCVNNRNGCPTLE